MSLWFTLFSFTLRSPIESISPKRAVNQGRGREMGSKTICLAMRHASISDSRVREVQLDAIAED